MTLLNHDAAFRFVRDRLIALKYTNVSAMIPQNKGRHCLLKTDQGNFYCLFKHQFFWKYSEYFMELLGDMPYLNGAGESINVSCLGVALENNAQLLYVYGDNNIYLIDPLKILDLHSRAFKYYTSGIIRSQDKSNTYKIAYTNGIEEDINEATYVFPIRLFIKLN